MLPLPNTRQTEPHKCGEAARDCLLTFFKYRPPFKRLATPEGTEARAIEDSLRWDYGLRVMAGGMDEDVLRWLTQTYRPVICLIQEPGHESHYVVVAKVSTRNVFVQDPEVGPRRIDLATWKQIWQATDARNSRPFRQWGIAAWLE